MESRSLGKDGPRVSVLGIGTVSLGIDYGISQPGNSGRPMEDEAVATLQHAHGLGFTFYDTAPAYGVAETVLGRALSSRADAILATKVTIPKEGDLAASIAASITRSQRALGRDPLPLVQIHNATVELLEGGTLVRALVAEQQRGRIAKLGASVYTEAEALAAIDTGVFATIQVGFSMLDRRMATRVFPRAIERGVGVIVRSVYLKGVLTDKGEHLPKELGPLKEATDEICRVAGITRAELPSLALRYAIAQEAVSTVIVGVRTAAEVDVAHAALADGVLSPSLLEKISRVKIADERLLNPATWPAL